MWNTAGMLLIWERELTGENPVPLLDCLQEPLHGMSWQSARTSAGTDIFKITNISNWLDIQKESSMLDVSEDRNKEEKL